MHPARRANPNPRMLVRSETLPRVFSCGLRAQSRARGVGGRGREERKAERGAVGGARPLAPRGGATVATNICSYADINWYFFLQAGNGPLGGGGGQGARAALGVRRCCSRTRGRYVYIYIYIHIHIYEVSTLNSVHRAASWPAHRAVQWTPRTMSTLSWMAADVSRCSTPKCA